MASQVQTAAREAFWDEQEDPDTLEPLRQSQRGHLQEISAEIECAPPPPPPRDRPPPPGPALHMPPPLHGRPSTAQTPRLFCPPACLPEQCACSCWVAVVVARRALLAQCCAPTMERAPKEAMRRLKDLASRPKGGMMVQWIADTLALSVAPDVRQCHGAVKTTSLMKELVGGGSAGFRQELKALCTVRTDDQAALLPPLPSIHSHCIHMPHATCHCSKQQRSCLSRARARQL
eukprot:COSAG01_NODE_440_length_17033_cov_16.301110_9_plen_233_part_00